MHIDFIFFLGISSITYSIIIMPGIYLNTLLTAVKCSFPDVDMYILNTPIAWEILGRVQTI